MAQSNGSAPPAPLQPRPARPADRGWALRQRSAATVVLVFAVAVTVTSYGYGLHADTQPGPGLFPFIIGVLLIVLSVIWLIRPGRAEADEPADLVATVLDEAEQEAGESGLEEELTWTREGTIRFAATLGLTVLAIVLFVTLGYTVSVAVYTAALLIVVARRRPLWSIVGAVVGAIASRMLFDYLGIVLPSLPVDLSWLPLAVL